MDIPVLLYHSNLLKDGFKNQMEYLVRHGFKVTSVYEFMQNPGNLMDNSVMITFDDGYLNDFEIVFPVLKYHNLVAHFFITTNFVGKRNFMNWQQLDRLSQNGFIIGSHTAFHRDLSRSQDREIIEELEFSKSIIEERLGITTDLISMPHGAFNRKIYKAAKQLGYKAIFVSIPIYRISNIQPYVFGRFSIKQDISLDEFRQIISKKNRIQKRMYLSYSLKKLGRGLLPKIIRNKLQQMP